MVAATRLSKTVASGQSMLEILRDVSLQVSGGESCAIQGVSGSGKSTLLAILAGLDLPTHGEVWLNGRLLNDLDEDARAQLRAQHVGFIFQNFFLLAHLTALENVMLPLELRGDEDAKDRALALLERVGLQARISHHPSELSGGEQQRVAIARAFAVQPDIVFADEPTGNLDSRTGQQISELLFHMNQEVHTTLVMSTHDQVIAKLCQTRYLLSEGVLTPLV